MNDHDVQVALDRETEHLIEDYFEWRDRENRRRIRNGLKPIIPG